MSLFTILKQDPHTPARRGRLTTAHGTIETPCFMPVGTQAGVKTLDQDDMKTLGAEIMLANTYHLHLRPGEDLIGRQGGLHKFMNWNGALLTDSGGFQVFSLGLQKARAGTGDQGKLVTIDDEGVTFKSHLDGSMKRFTPESAIDIQHKLGADIIMAFDECTPDDATTAYARTALERTHRWAVQSLAAHEANRQYHGYEQFVFGIVQGGTHRELREESARFITNLAFDGLAIGGESIGYNMTATADILDWVVPILDPNRPRYTMGLGLNPYDLLIAVSHGADMFDCVAPTRLARHGMIYIKDPSRRHRLNIKNAAFKNDLAALDANCTCFTCTRYTRSYIHHLFVAEEMTAMRLASIHNLAVMLNLMRDARRAIEDDRLLELINEWKIPN